CFFFQAEDGIRDRNVTGVQTCALPIWYFFDLPFLFNYDPNDNDVYMDNKKAFVESEEGGRKVAAMMEEKGVKVLSMSSTDIYGRSEERRVGKECRYRRGRWS